MRATSLSWLFATSLLLAACMPTPCSALVLPATWPLNGLQSYIVDALGNLLTPGPVEKEEGTSTPAIGNIHTKVQRVRRLRDPRGYTMQRNRLLANARRHPTPDVAVNALQSYHSLLEWEDVDLIVPDVSKRATLLALAKMSSTAYESPPDPPSWEPGFEGWNLTESFGWVENGIRGHIFTSGPDNETIIVALKGTSAGILPGGDDTGRRDKLNVRYDGCEIDERFLSTDVPSLARTISSSHAAALASRGHGHPYAHAPSHQVNARSPVWSDLSSLNP